MATGARPRPGLWAIPVAAAVLTLPVSALLDRPIASAAGSILCSPPHGTLVVSVSRDLVRDQRYVGSSGATCACVDPATEEDCRWGRSSCRATGVSTVATYATLLGLAFAIALLPTGAVVLLLRRRQPH